MKGERKDNVTEQTECEAEQGERKAMDFYVLKALKLSESCFVTVFRSSVEYFAFIWSMLRNSQAINIAGICQEPAEVQ